MYKIVADSSCDLKDFPSAPFETVPLSLSTDEATFVDDTNLDVTGALHYLSTYHGRSYTACPSTVAWTDAFDGADEIYVVTITSGLSGTYASACLAVDQFLAEHPEKKICVVDSLSTGPGLVLLIEKIAEWKEAGKSFEEVATQIVEYQKSLRLFFALQSLHNLAVNGRVNKLIASAIGIMGIRILGTASSAGTIDPIAKCRGDKSVLDRLVKEIKECGYHGGKIRICHVENLPFAKTIAEKIREIYGEIDLQIVPARALCGYYAEQGGIILGCEC